MEKSAERVQEYLTEYLEELELQEAYHLPVPDNHISEDWQPMPEVLPSGPADLIF